MQSILKYKECAALHALIPLEVAEILKRKVVDLGRLEGSRNTWNTGVKQNARNVAERGLVIEECEISQLSRILEKYQDASVEAVEFDERNQCYRIVEPAPSL